MQKFTAFILSFALCITTLSGCGSPEAPPEKPEMKKQVVVRTAEESRRLVTQVSYPGTVISEQEATVAAKVAGTVTETFAELGDEVVLGQRLLTIDAGEANATRTSYETARNALENAQATSSNQIVSAELGADQAKTSFDLAQKNYQNTVISAREDLKQAEIARDQAEKNQQNVGATTVENVRSAQLAYENSQILTAQAKLNLENRQELLEQTRANTLESTEIAMRSFADSAKVIINSINTITGFFDPDDVIVIDYLLGSLDTKVLNAARAAFQKVWTTLTNYERTEFASLEERIAMTLRLLEETKELVDFTKQTLEKTVPNGGLPLDSTAPGGKSLNSFKTLLTNYQSQINNILTQAKAAEQAYTDFDLERRATLDSLQKGYDLALQQEAIAKQSLANLAAANTAQTDQSAFGAASARTQFEATRVRLESQVNAAKAQVDLSSAQYQAALSAVKNARDLRSAQLDASRGQLDLAAIQLENLTPRAPFSGKVIQKLVNTGDAVTPGQSLAVISAPEMLKIQFYIDAEFVPRLTRGQPVEISTDDRDQFPGAIARIAPVADAVTKRFLVEVLPENQESASALLAGTIVTVDLELSSAPQNPGALIVPLAALSISPSESSLFIVRDAKAEKVPVQVLKVEGEQAEIRANLSAETPIVIEGNKLLQAGAEVEVQATPASTPSSPDETEEL